MTFIEFLLKEEWNIPEGTKDVCSICPAWGKEYCLLEFCSYKSDFGLTCKIDLEKKKVILIEK